MELKKTAIFIATHLKKHKTKAVFAFADDKVTTRCVNLRESFYLIAFGWGKNFLGLLR